jgi:hypothetical protein
VKRRRLPTNTGHPNCENPILLILSKKIPFIPFASRNSVKKSSAVMDRRHRLPGYFIASRQRQGVLTLALLIEFSIWAETAEG